MGEKKLTDITNKKNGEIRKLKNELFLKNSDLKNIKINNDELQKKIFDQNQEYVDLLDKLDNTKKLSDNEISNLKKQVSFYQLVNFYLKG